MPEFIAKHIKHTLNFKRPSGTSRGILKNKDSWFILISSSTNPVRVGIGECSLIKGLSIDNRPDFENKLAQCCDDISASGNVSPDNLASFPAIRFGLETAILDLEAKNERILFPSAFTEGSSIPINGLVWMGDARFMRQQIREKLDAGFSCLKLKIGAIDFLQELELLKLIRKSFSSDDLELRVDANGAFHPNEAMEKLKQLAAYDLHSIEQPIRPGQIEKMAKLCAHSPIPIALDEELIGIVDLKYKKALLDTIKPQYIILKPSLVGGFEASEEWIALAKKWNIGWWVTSALESNIGLNAIAQWIYSLKSRMPQGLGTGQLYTNNFSSPLCIANGRLFYDPRMPWMINKLLQ